MESDRGFVEDQTLVGGYDAVTDRCWSRGNRVYDTGTELFPMVIGVYVVVGVQFRDARYSGRWIVYAWIVEA